jgi:hypothetical protein
MRRRDFVGVICGAALAAHYDAHAQQSTKLWRIGDVLVTTPDRGEYLARALEQALSDLEDMEGRNILLSHRFAGPQPNNVRKVIASLLPEIDLLFVRGTIGGVAAKELAGDMPTVFFRGRPGRNWARPKSRSSRRQHDRHNLRGPRRRHMERDCRSSKKSYRISNARLCCGLLVT